MKPSTIRSAPKVNDLFDDEVSFSSSEMFRQMLDSNYSEALIVEGTEDKRMSWTLSLKDRSHV